MNLPRDGDAIPQTSGPHGGAPSDAAVNQRDDVERATQGVHDAVAALVDARIAWLVRLASDS